MSWGFRHDGCHEPRRTPLECRIEVTADCTVVHVSGEVDLATIHILERALDSAMAASYSIVVDLAATRYMDGAGLRVLLKAKQRHRHPLAVVAPTPTLRRIFEIVRIDRIVPLYGTREEALAALCAATPPGGDAASLSPDRPTPR